MQVLSEIARQLDTTIEVIRELLDNHPDPASHTAAQRFGIRGPDGAEESLSGRSSLTSIACNVRSLAEVSPMIGASRPVDRTSLVACRTSITGSWRDFEPAAIGGRRASDIAPERS